MPGHRLALWIIRFFFCFFSRRLPPRDARGLRVCVSVFFENRVFVVDEGTLWIYRTQQKHTHTQGCRAPRSHLCVCTQAYTTHMHTHAHKETQTPHTHRCITRHDLFLAHVYTGIQTQARTCTHTRTHRHTQTSQNATRPSFSRGKGGQHQVGQIRADRIMMHSICSQIFEHTSNISVPI